MPVIIAVIMLFGGFFVGVESGKAQQQQRAQQASQVEQGPAAPTGLVASVEVEQPGTEDADNAD